MLGTRARACTHTRRARHTHTCIYGCRCWANEQTQATVQGATVEGLALHKQAVSMQVFFFSSSGPFLFFFFVRAFALDKQAVSRLFSE